MLNYHETQIMYSEGTLAKSGVDYNLPEQRQTLDRLFAANPTLLAMLPDDLPIVLIRDPNIPCAGINPLTSELVMIFNLWFIEDITEESFFSFGEILAHELVHVAQFRSGRMKALNDKTTLWEGKAYPTVGLEDFLGYITQPWEIEAQDAGLRWLVDNGVVASMEEAVRGMSTAIYQRCG